MFGLIADIWSHVRELSLAILSSLSSWRGSLQRYSDKPPSDWGHLVPPLLVAQHLCSCRLHLCICSGPDTHTHTHTHTHTQIQPTQAHACIHTCLAWGHKCKQGTQVFQELKTALSSNVGDGVNRHHVLPLGLPVHLLPKLLRIFPRKPEATSSAACVVVVVTSEW